MRIGAAVTLLTAALFVAPACGVGGVPQYEYEEVVHVSLDGSARVYVNASVAALNALRGTSFDTSASAKIDPEAIRDLYASSVTHVVGTPKLSRRGGRTFVHVGLDVYHVQQLEHTPPFAWSSYDLSQDGDLYLYRQRVEAPSAKAVGAIGWTGQELVAFRVRMPSTIVSHNTGSDRPRRGNILVWEQPLTDRLRGEPVQIEARIERSSILFGTLLVFGGSALSVAVTIGLVLWWLFRRRRVAATRP